MCLRLALRVSARRCVSWGLGRVKPRETFVHYGCVAAIADRRRPLGTVGSVSRLVAQIASDGEARVLDALADRRHLSEDRL